MVGCVGELWVTGPVTLKVTVNVAVRGLRLRRVVKRATSNVWDAHRSYATAIPKKIRLSIGDGNLEGCVAEWTLFTDGVLQVKVKKRS